MVTKPVSSYFFIPFSSAFASQTGIVNRNLKPERGDQFEIGSKGKPAAQQTQLSTGIV